MIARTLRHFGVNTTPKNNASNFTDISKVSSYAKQDVLFLEDNRIYPPSSSKTFNPRERATRGDVFFMLFRTLEAGGLENYMSIYIVENPSFKRFQIVVSIEF